MSNLKKGISLRGRRADNILLAIAVTPLAETELNGCGSWFCSVHPSGGKSEGKVKEEQYLALSNLLHLILSSNLNLS
tara:strand:+ start:195 stop:425 length:231 start_codon:yes stop_codon:yes gene_type:complete